MTTPETPDDGSGPSSSDTSGEDPMGEIAATHPPPEPWTDIPDSSETSHDDPMGQIAETFPGGGPDPQTESE